MMKQLTFQGHTIAFNVHGNGETPVVLLHGFCEDSRVWDDFLAAFQSDQYQCITIDWPGFGASSYVENLSMEWMADAVHAVVASLDVKRYLAVGHSMGGYAALALAERWGSELTGVGLFHSHPYSDTPDKKASRDRSSDFVAEHGTPLFVRQLIPTLFAPAFAEANPDIIEDLIEKNSNIAPKAIQAALVAMRDRPDRTQVLRRLKCPVLLIIGQEDAAIPANQSRAQTVLAPMASIRLLQGVGHMGMYEAPAETAKIVDNFVSFCYIYVPDPV